MTASIYKSELEGKTFLTGTVVKVGGHPENVSDNLTYSYWLPDVGASISAFFSIDLGANHSFDFIAIESHNFKEIADLKHIYIESFPDASYTGGTVHGLTLAADLVEGANVIEFAASLSRRYWRFFVVANTALVTDPILGVLYAGEKLDLPRGIKPSYTPPKLGKESKVLNNNSNSGHFIGRSVIAEKYSFVIKNDLVSKDWIDANWKPLLDYIELKPFFYSWNSIFPDESVYCWTVGKLPQPGYIDGAWLSFRFNCTGYL